MADDTLKKDFINKKSKLQHLTSDNQVPFFLKPSDNKILKEVFNS